MHRIFTALLALLALLATARHAAAEPAPATPPLSARASLLMDFHSGAVLAANNAGQPMEPASITKLMTAYVVFDALRAKRIALTDPVTISERAWRMQGSRMFVELGKQVNVEDLLKGMIVQSGNDATVALAEHVAGSEEAFVELMNRAAGKLGLRHSHFMNSAGMPDPQHHMSAQDIALLARALIREFPDHYRWYSLREFAYNGITQHNRNTLLWRDASVDGVKTGHTESAGYCLVNSAKRGEMRLISVVLGTANAKLRADESLALLNHGFRFFETHRLYTAGKPLTEARIWKGAVEKLPLGIAEDLYVTVPRGEYDKLKAALKLTPTLLAPATRNQRYGTLTINQSGKSIAERPLVALADVAEGSLWQQIVDGARLYWQ
jgi:D-alanyl-D-alanine carboxypeptidase (penicillin-binding protein 5/6)